MLLSCGRFVALILLSLFVVNGDDKGAAPSKPAAAPAATTASAAAAPAAPSTAVAAAATTTTSAPAAALTTTTQPAVNGSTTAANSVTEAPERSMFNTCCNGNLSEQSVCLLIMANLTDNCTDNATSTDGTVNITLSPFSAFSSTPSTTSSALSTTSSTSSSITSSTTTSTPPTTTEKPKHVNGNENVWVALKPSAYNKKTEPNEVYYFMARKDTMRSPNANQKGKNDVLFGFMIAFNVLWFIIFLLTPLFAYKHPSRIQPSIREAVGEEKAVIRTDTTPTDDVVVIEPEGLIPAQAPSSTANQSTPPDKSSTPT